MATDFYVDLPVISGSGSGVTSINGETGAITLVAGSGISIVDSPAGTFTISNTGSGATYTFSDSLVNTAGTVTLVNDSASPGNSKYYGTNSSGTLGYFSLPTVTSGNLTDAGTDGITITGGTGAVLGSGTSISQHVADTSHNGYLSSTDWNTFNGKGSGTVTSVGLSDPGIIYTVSGSPVTTSGTLTLNLITQTANTVFSGPSSGSAATPTFRSLVAADLPSGTVTTIGAIDTNANSNGLFISGNTLSTQSASATNPGMVNSTTQTFGGAKTFNSNVTIQSSVILNGATSGAFTLSAAGTTTSYSAVLPASQGAAGSSIQNDGSGNLSWTTSGSSFLTSGTTYTTPASVTTNTKFKFTLIGGGGAGAGTTSSDNIGVGGGAGGTAIVYVTGLSPSMGYTIAIGGGGSGNSGATGGNGGNTTLTIGTTTYTAAFGTGGTLGTRIQGGAGGTTTNATIGITGQQGGANPFTAVPVAVSGFGGSTMFGSGGGQVPTPSSGNTVGNAGSGYGSGGSGSGSVGTTGTAGTGGAGAPGCILVEYWT